MENPNLPKSAQIGYNGRPKSTKICQNLLKLGKMEDPKATQFAKICPNWVKHITQIDPNLPQIAILGEMEDQNPPKSVQILSRNGGRNLSYFHFTPTSAIFLTS